MGKIFGTDGIRGTANVFPMTPELALLVGKAVAHVFGGKRPRIVIGKDTRLSGYMIESALTSGAVSMGADVYLVGPLPTPALAHLTKSLNCDAGIVLTASHNPAKDNGIKIFSGDGYKLPDEVENQIEELLLTKKISSEHIKGDKIGKAYRLDEAKGRYIEFAKATIKSKSLRGMKIVVDCANGAAYYVAPKIFSELGADVIVINDKPDGLNINKDCGALYPECVKDIVLKEKADIGIALDGDADRCIIVDEKGNIVTGDHILAIAALDMKKNNRLKGCIVGTIMSNLGLDAAMKKEGIEVIRTQVGDRYVIEEMKKKKCNIGGENSGHIIFNDYVTTGDGVITALQLLKIMKDNNKKLSELAASMQMFPTVMVNIEVKEKKPFGRMPNVMKKIKDVESKLKNGRTVIRYSGTENLARVFIEGEDESQIKKFAKEIADLIKKEIGK